MVFIFTSGCVDPYALANHAPMTNFLHGYVLPVVFRAMVMLNLRLLIRWLVVIWKNHRLEVRQGEIGMTRALQSLFTRHRGVKHTHSPEGDTYLGN